jgi:hypothetical protein
MPSLPPEIAAELDTLVTVPPDRKKTPYWVMPVTAPRFVTVPTPPETTIPPPAPVIAPVISLVVAPPSASRTPFWLDARRVPAFVTEAASMT